MVVQFDQLVWRRPGEAERLQLAHVGRVHPMTIQFGQLVRRKIGQARLPQVDDEAGRNALVV